MHHYIHKALVARLHLLSQYYVTCIDIYSLLISFVVRSVCMFA